MATVISEDFESGTPGNNYSGALTSTVVAPGAVRYASDSVEGSVAINCLGDTGGGAGAGTASLHYQEGALFDGARFMDFLVKFNSWQASAIIFAQQLATTTNRCQLRAASGTITMRNGTTTVATLSETLELGTWYRFAWRVDGVADTQTLRFFKGANLGGTVPDEEINGAYTQSTRNRYLIQIAPGTSFGNTDFDRLIIDDADWPVPPTISGGGFEPELSGTGSFNDQIFASLIAQGFTAGSISDRERNRLLSKLSKPSTSQDSLLDLYLEAGEPIRILGEKV